MMVDRICLVTGNGWHRHTHNSAPGLVAAVTKSRPLHKQRLHCARFTVAQLRPRRAHFEPFAVGRQPPVAATLHRTEFTAFVQHPKHPTSSEVDRRFPFGNVLAHSGIRRLVCCRGPLAGGVPGRRGELNVFRCSTGALPLAGISVPARSRGMRSSSRPARSRPLRPIRGRGARSS